MTDKPKDSTIRRFYTDHGSGGYDGEKYFYNPSSLTYPKKEKPMSTGERQLGLFEKPVPSEYLLDSLPINWNFRDAMLKIQGILETRDMSDKAKPQVYELIALYGLMLTDLLLRKNARYGDSATNPLSVFAKDISARERMRVRMDDKISRIVRGQALDDNEDPRIDLAGYLLLDLILDALED